MTSDHKMLEAKLNEQRKQLDKKYMVQIIDILDRMEKRFGSGVYQVVEETVAESTIAKWSEIARGEESRTVADIIRLLWEPLRARGFEFSMEEKEDGIQVYCTKCALNDLAQEIDGTDWMFYLKCASDPYIVQGFNPRILFRRTKTLMEGHACCDHFYGYAD